MIDLASKLRDEADLCRGEGRVLQAALIDEAVSEIDRLKAAIAAAERERDEAREAVPMALVRHRGREFHAFADRDEAESHWTSDPVAIDLIRVDQWRWHPAGTADRERGRA